MGISALRVAVVGRVQRDRQPHRQGVRRPAGAMPGTQPTVEIAIAGPRCPGPSGELIAAQASSTASRFCSGSPMPMKTTLVRRAPCGVGLAARRARPGRRSRPAVRSRPAPMRAGGAERQPSAQPAWLETQTVRRPAAWAIRTASTTAPSAARRPHLTVPSRETTRASGVSAQNGSVVGQAAPQRRRQRGDLVPARRRPRAGPGRPGARGRRARPSRRAALVRAARSTAEVGSAFAAQVSVDGMGTGDGPKDAASGRHGLDASRRVRGTG